MKNAEELMRSFLSGKKNNLSLRRLISSEGLVDFCSNDYLGLANSKELFHRTSEILEQFKEPLNGSTGSRLLTGNNKHFIQLENKIAAFHHAEAALIFNSGFDANFGLISSIAGKSDSIIYDELSHASIRDGIRLSTAKPYKFKHNDLSDLEHKLKISNGIVYVIVESLYSMDGDKADLKEINKLCQKYSANLIIDEAHAGGIYGENGNGLACANEISHSVFARIITFGKAFGTHGAAVIGSKVLKEFLVNVSRPLMYSTALPPHSIAAISAAYDLQSTLDGERKKLFDNIKYFKNQISKLDLKGFLTSNTAIQSIIVPGNAEVKKLAEVFQNKGYDIRPILSPTVKSGTERLRVCIHSFNHQSDIRELGTILKQTTHESIPI
ncbi:MAG TPA: pyridoxal phosphate-dependent aminotransferase family protein [Bacteroidia bacterium]|nr:pyridoxal phosphate-dependent aminotransferase family protein [Bacteroidia bacterium]